MTEFLSVHGYGATGIRLYRFLVSEFDVFCQLFVRLGFPWSLKLYLIYRLAAAGEVPN